MAQKFIPHGSLDVFVEDNLKYMKHCGLVGVAVIIYNAESPIVVKQFWQSIYEKQDFPQRFFDSENDAKSWLLDLIASAPS